LVRYLLRDGWWDWAEILHVDAGELNLGFPRKKIGKNHFGNFFFFFSKGKKNCQKTNFSAPTSTCPAAIIQPFLSASKRQIKSQKIYFCLTFVQLLGLPPVAH
jgi:hypothetical protein